MEVVGTPSRDFVYLDHAATSPLRPEARAAMDPFLYVGVYRLTPAMNVTITRDGDQLMAQATGQGAFPLLATSETEFHFQPAELRITFPAGEGPAPEFTMFQSVEMKATRITPAPN